MYTNLSDAEARVSAMYPIHMIGDVESPPKWLVELVECCTDIGISEIFDDHYELRNVRDPERFDDHKAHATAVAECWLYAGRTGFIVFSEICVRRYTGNGGSFFSSFGMVRLHWFFAATVEEIVPKLLAIAEEQHDGERRSAADRGAA